MLIEDTELDELLRKETARSEWKENVADVTEVLPILSSFANDYERVGGGYVICGVRETTDANGFDDGFTKAERVGLDAARLKS